MNILDRGLIDKCVSRAGGTHIHDVRGVSSIYLNCCTNYTKGLAIGMDEVYISRQKYLAEKYERILLSFLVTGDIKESKRIIEECLKGDGHEC